MKQEHFTGPWGGVGGGFLAILADIVEALGVGGWGGFWRSLGWAGCIPPPPLYIVKYGNP